MSMNQELISGGGNGGNTTTSFATGSVCPKTGLYKTFDGKIEVIEYYAVGDLFRTGPGGNGTKKCTWTRVTLASDGGKTSYTAVKVVAGTA
jgi:hypothetical protein